MPILQKRELLDLNSEKYSISWQSEVLGISRSGFYYKPKGESSENLRMMEAIDMIFTNDPTLGQRRMILQLSEQGFHSGRGRVRRLMKLMGLESCAPRPGTSHPSPDHPVFPYLLRNLIIDAPNLVWATDITYIPVKKGFYYLIAIMDWYSRYILSWQISNTMDTAFCLEAFKDSLRYGKPQIFNSDQGSQFTSQDWLEAVLGADIRVSMDGKGRFRDNIFIERFWRTLKYEEVYLNEYNDGIEVFERINRYIEYYNNDRRHSKLKNCTPAEVFFGKVLA